MLLTPWLRSIKSSVFTNRRRLAHRRLVRTAENRAALLAAEVQRLEDRTLLSGDVAVTMAVSPSSVGEEVSTNLDYTFTRTGSTSDPITVDFRVGGTATPGSDYSVTGADSFTATAGAVTIAAGSATATVTIDPTNETFVELDETVTLTVVAGLAYGAGTADTATGTIIDDDIVDDAGNVIRFIPREGPALPAPPVGPDAQPMDYPLPQTFFLHSNPGASKVIYLDFDGHTTTGTAWNTWSGVEPIVTPAYDFDGDASSFSDPELQRIQNVWDIVSEDFIPFDVDVTTEDPGVAALRNTGGGDTAWGVRVVIGPDQMSTGAGGIAFIGSFDWNSDTPCFVFNVSEKGVAEAASHEVGHTVGLIHDGTSSLGYYPGHGSGPTGWAPIMGVGYSKQLVQWSRGEYPDANNTEDDLAIITTQNGFGYRTDDHGSTTGTASSLGVVGGTTVSDEGIIERNTDQDYFVFTTGAGTITLDVNPFYRSPNLDVLATLYDDAGTPIATSNPVDALDASFNPTVAAGVYYLSVEGAGKPAAGIDFGYSDYGSLGYYTISGTIFATDAGDAPTSAQSGFTGSYPTTLADNGAMHTATGPTLGANRDAESDGQPTANADGDDTTGSPDDEDGLVLQSNLAPGRSATFVLNVQGVSGTHFVNAWIDFNADGDWSDPGEQIATDFAVTAAGNHMLSFAVPDAAVLGDTYTRLRLSSTAGLSFTGSADDGEVEDYLVTITDAPASVAATSAIFVEQTSELLVTAETDEPIDVLVFGGYVLVNLTSPDTGSLPATSVRKLTVEGGSGGNVIDLTGVTAADGFVNLATIVVNAGQGPDTILTSPLGGKYRAGHGDDLIIGDVGDDTIFGDDGHDTIRAGDGNDSLFGGDGNDLIEGEGGNDFADAGDGSDSVDGGIGNDNLRGGNGADTLNGNDGDDTLNGGAGVDLLNGGADNDRVLGGADNDLLFGDAGNDTLKGQGGADTLDGGDDDDLADGGAGDDLILGSVGDDKLKGRGGADTLDGGDGNDNLNGGGNHDTLIGGADNDTLRGGAASDRLFGDGSDPEDTIRGDDLLQGQGGKDTLIGGNGSDILDGGVGDDLVQSGDIPVQELPPVLFINDVLRVAEGDSGTTDVVFTVAMSDVSSLAVTVDFATADGTATGGPDAMTPFADYVIANGTLTFNPGVTTQSITVEVIGDIDLEPDETFLVNLTNVVNATVADPQGQATIIDDDLRPGGILITPTDDVATLVSAVTAGGGTGIFVTSTVLEGQNNGSGVLSTGTYTVGSAFTYGLTRPGIVISSGDVADYETGPDTSGSTTWSYGVAATPAQEALLDQITGGTFNHFDATRLIINFDLLPGADTLSFEVTFGSEEFPEFVGSPFLDGFGLFVNGTNIASVAGSPVNINHPDMMALPGTELDGVLAPAGDPKLVFSQFLGDGATGNTLEIILADTTDSSLDTTAYISSVGANRLTEFSVDDVSIDEGDAGTTDLVFTVTLSNTVPTPVTVDFATVDGTALAGVDYQSVAGTLTFPANETTATIAVPIIGDTLNEPDETFLMILSNPIDATIADDIGIGIINDDDTSSVIDDDTLRGGRGSDTIMGAHGNDFIRGDAGNDSIDGGAGNDNLEGRGGNDTLVGNSGDDTLRGQGAADVIFGDIDPADPGYDPAIHNGFDVILWNSGDGNDTIDGGLGFDDLQVNTGSENDTVLAAAEGTQLTVTASTVANPVGETTKSQFIEKLTVNTNAGADAVRVEDLGDVSLLQFVEVDAGSGTDLVDASSQAKRSLRLFINGGRGDDTLIGGDSLETIHGDAGDDSLLAGAGDDCLFGGNGQDSLFGGAGNDGLQGEDDRDVLYGEAGNDNLDGGRGNDNLFGGTGDDLLLGNSGDDRAAGEAGDDTLEGNAGDDTLDGGDGDDTLFGQAGVDSLLGQSGNDQLSGGDEDDRLIGGAGNDLLLGETGNDHLNGNDGLDTLGGGFGDDTLLGGSGSDELAGDAGNDTISGNSGHDSIRGGDGRDLLRGGLGNDTLAGGDDNDTLLGEGGNDALAGQDGQDVLNGGADVDTLVSGNGNDTLRGGAGADFLIAGSGDDNLDGQGGVDTLSGGQGTDTMTGFAEDVIDESIENIFDPKKPEFAWINAV